MHSQAERRELPQMSLSAQDLRVRYTAIVSVTISYDQSLR